MKKIAVPVLNGNLSSHFGHCETFAFFNVEDNQIKEVIELEAPEHQPGSFPKWVAAQGATDVIAGGIGPSAVQLFEQYGVNVYIGAPSMPIRELVTDFLQNKLELNVNLCHHPRDGHGHGHHHHGN